jgi:hypothetical protein
MPGQFARREFTWQYSQYVQFVGTELQSIDHCYCLGPRYKLHRGITQCEQLLQVGMLRTRTSTRRIEQ